MTSRLFRHDELFPFKGQGMLRGFCVCMVTLFAFAASRPLCAQDHTNSLGMKLAKIPAGEFEMGGHESKDNLQKGFPNYEPRRIQELVDEYPLHKVRITKPYYMGKHEVTVGQFKKFLEQSDYKTQAESDGQGGWGYNKQTGEFEGRKPEYSWKNPGFPQGDDHPVVNVSWYDAVEMCKWLSKTEGKKYRLPTEAEWEYACRAGTKTRFHFGDDPEGLSKAAAYYDAKTREVFPEWKDYATKSSDGFQFTAPVGTFEPNKFGLFDMHGNVWEWCSDWHADDYYSQSPVDDPQGPTEGMVKVRRGGSWHTWPFYCRSSFRNWNSPRTRYVLMGFRLVME